jgi:hypothetical protein
MFDLKKFPRLPKPPQATDDTYELILKLTTAQPNERPTISDVLTSLNKESGGEQSNKKEEDINRQTRTETNINARPLKDSYANVEVENQSQEYYNSKNNETKELKYETAPSTQYEKSPSDRKKEE